MASKQEDFSDEDTSYGSEDEEIVYKEQGKKSTNQNVLLGHMNYEIPLEDDCDPLCTKFGGLPVWSAIQSPKKDEVIKLCNECKNPLLLVLQAYAPLDSLPDHHRVIYIFGCNNPKCSNTSKGWKVLRTQMPIEKVEKKAIQVASVAKKVEKTDEWDTGDWGGDDSSWTDTSSQDLELLLKTRDISLASSETKEKPQGKSDSTTHDDFDRSLNPYNKDNCSYFMPWDVYIEKEPGKPGATRKEIKIMKEYEKEDVDGGSNGWDGEKYEPDKEKVFNKFHERLNRSNTQCLRYSFNGEPLWISNDTPKNIPRCPRCDSERVYELQLMPTLLHLYGGLKLSQNENEVKFKIVDGTGDGLKRTEALGIEFGVVAVFSCPLSCQSRDSDFVEEYVFVQAAI